MGAGVGLPLHPDRAYLALTEPLLAGCDYVELVPETMWRAEDGAPNGFHRAFRALIARWDLDAVGHGVAFDLGCGHVDEARRNLWLEHLVRDHATFGFRWISDHLGATSVAGEQVGLPMPLPPTALTAARTRASLDLLGALAPAAVENSAWSFYPGDPLEEPAWLLEASAGHQLVLDLHNLVTSADNLGFEPEAWLERLDLGKVVELHVSGGSESPTAWLASGRSFRLDSHDEAVPERVWALLEHVLPRCPALRGVTLERREGTVTASDVPQLAEELARVRFLVERA